MYIIVAIITLLLLAKYALWFLVFAFEASFRLLALYLIYLLVMGILKSIFKKDVVD